MAKKEDKKDYFLTPEGLYNPIARYAFTNITEEVFETAWDGNDITIKPGITVELGHSQAQNFTKQLVDKIMIGNAKLDELAKDKPYYQSPLGMHLGIPAQRKVWEDKIVRELKVDEESPQTQIMRAKIKEELLADMAQQPSGGSPTIPTSINDFADLLNPQEAATNAPMAIKEIDPSKE